MVTYKFLARGAIGPLSGFVWPAADEGAPGPWVEVEGALTPCARGAHVCRTTDLAHWLHDELWEVETDGDQIEGVDCLVVRRARLVRRILAWSDPAQRRSFAKACVDHATAETRAFGSELASGLLEDAAGMAEAGYAPLSAYASALAVSHASSERAAAFRRERAWQSRWIATRILEISRAR